MQTQRKETFEAERKMKTKRIEVLRAAGPGLKSLPCRRCSVNDSRVRNRGKFKREANQYPRIDYALWPAHCNTPRYLLHGPTASRYW